MGLIEKNDNGSWKLKGVGWSQIKPGAVINILEVMAMFKTVSKKILPCYYDAVVNGIKAFEIRKDEDDIQAGDILTLREWDGSQYTGRVANMLVKYVLRDVPQYGLMRGYCIIGF